MTTPAWVPRKRRGAEFFLTVLAVFIGITAYAAVGLGVEGTIPADTYKLGFALIVVAVATHLIVRRVAPYADPVLRAARHRAQRSRPGDDLSPRPRP